MRKPTDRLSQRPPRNTKAAKAQWAILTAPLEIREGAPPREVFNYLLKIGKERFWGRVFSLKNEELSIFVNSYGGHH